MPLQSSPVSNPSNPLALPQGGRIPFQGYNAKQIYALTDKSRAFDYFHIHETALLAAKLFDD
jgi:hypothetical protein